EAMAAGGGAGWEGAVEGEPAGAVGRAAAAEGEAGPSGIDRHVVDPAVAVVVEAVADFHAAIGHQAAILAAIRWIAVDVVEVGQAAIEAALPGRAGADRVLEVAAVAALAAVGLIGLQIKVVVDDAVAVVVHAVADLDAAVGHGALASIGGIVVRVAMPEGAGAELTLAAHAQGARVREQALVTAHAAVVHVGLQVE